MHVTRITPRSLSRVASAAVFVAGAIGTGVAHAQVAHEDEFAAAPSVLPDGFAAALDIDGPHLVVGSPFDDSIATDAGSVLVYERQVDGTWTIQATIAPSDLAANAHFGDGVALDGDRMLVGAPGDEVNGPNAGAAFLFERQGDGTWSEVARVRPTDGTAGDTFGKRLDLDGDRFVVAASRDSLTAFGRAAYVFERQGDGSWPQAAKLVNSDHAPDDGFGASVAIDGEHIAVGASDFVQASPGPGAVYVFERQLGGNWSELQRLEGAVLSITNGYGSRMDLEGDVLAAGGVGVELVEVWTRSATGSWSRAQDLAAPGALGFDAFGNWIEVSGERIAIGAPLSDTVAGNGGSVHLFRRASATTWAHEVEFTPSNAAFSSFFGQPVAFDGTRVTAPPVAGDTVLPVLQVASLYHGDTELSAASGGTQDLLLRAGPERAGDAYALLGSASGTTPGVVDPVSGLTLPLVFDAYTNLIVNFGGAGIVLGWQGVLDGNGAANAGVVVPAATSPALVGAVLHHAFFTVEFVPQFNVTSVSDPVRVELVP